MDWHQTVHEQGYGLVPDVFSAREILAMLAHLGDEVLPRTRAGVRHAMRSSSIVKMANDTRMLQCARQIVGPGAVAFRATLFEKLPGANWLVGWHQDTALPLRDRREMSGWGPWSQKDKVDYAHAPAAALEKLVALRIHLDDSMSDNGPLRVLPGTHTRGVLTDDEIHLIAEGMAGTECLMPRGGVIAMRPLVIHASSKSQGGRRRRVLHIEYAESMNIGDGLELALA